MKRLCIAPIVEGHGEVEAIRVLLDRVWREQLGGDYLEVLPPVRQPRSKLLRWDPDEAVSTPNPIEISRAVRFAAAKLQDRSDADVPALVLLLLDADRDCPARLVPLLTETVQQQAGRCDAAVVVANIEYETWFVASAQSLTDHLEVTDEPPADPEQQRCGKGWIEERFRGPKYSETVDQARMTAAMDLQICRRKSPSFDKLCRVLEARLDRF